MQNRNFRPILISIGIVLSLIYFTIRGPARAVRHNPDGSQSQDFPNFYASARAWALGDDPYDHPFLESTFSHATSKQRWISGSLSSPTAFPLLILVSLLPYRAAEVLWLGLNVVFLFLSIRLLAGMGNFLENPARFRAFAVMAMALAGIHASLALGQVTMAVTLFVVASSAYELRREDTKAGVLLGFALALKPQMAATFLVYYIITRRWRLAIFAVAIFAATGAIAVGRMSHAHVAWVDSYRHNFDAFAAGPGDPQLSAAGVPVHDGLPSLMLNLQVPLSLVISNRTAVELVTLTIAAVLIVAIVALQVEPNDTTRPRLLAHAYLAAVAPLIVYSRMYTTAMLLIPIAWVISAYRADKKALAMPVLVCLVPFLIPGAGILARLASSVPGSIRDGFIWRGILMPHQTYALVAMVAFLLAAAVRYRRTTNAESRAGRTTGS